MPKLANLARMTTATAGTGTITLGTAVSGYLTFSQAGIADSDVVYYAIKDGANSEIGIGTYTTSGTTLSRDTVLNSTNSGSKITLSGTAEVFISPPASAWREVLIASRTYYVRTDGSDSNTGLVNSAGGAFLTGQKAVNTVAGLDLNGQTCTIQFGSGTYTGSINAATAFVGGVPTLQGDTTTPSNVLLNVSSYAIRAANGAEINVAGFKITSTGDALLAENAGRLNVTGNMDYGACTDSHMHAKYAGLITVTANYSITGGAFYHWWSETAGGSIKVIGRTITLTGTPAFTAFANATIVSQIVPVSNTYSGSATGSRYTVTLNSVILSGGATLPGNSAGSTATGGQYN